MNVIAWLVQLKRPMRKIEPTLPLDDTPVVEAVVDIVLQHTQILILLLTRIIRGTPLSQRLIPVRCTTLISQLTICRTTTIITTPIKQPMMAIAQVITIRFPS